MPATKKASPKKTATAKKPAAAKPSHPTYQVMVQEAIVALKERKGASRQAMKKYVTSEYKLAAISVVHFNGALKKLTEAGTLELSKTGQRWKFPKEATAAKPAVKKPTVKKPPAKKVTKKRAQTGKAPRKQLATKACRR